MSIERIAIFGTGLIGTSAGLALRAHGFAGEIAGWDPNARELALAKDRGAVDTAIADPIEAAHASDVVLLSGPVFTILDWLDRLAPVLGPGQLVTDVGSVMAALVAQAKGRYNRAQSAGYLPGHPMAGREVGGAANADAQLFAGAAWLFTEMRDPGADGLALRAAGSAWGDAGSALDADAVVSSATGAGISAVARSLAEEWRGWTEKFGCRVMDLDPERHDELCAWVSHLPQFVATALSALLLDEFEQEFEGGFKGELAASDSARGELLPIGGRALREMTRLGSSPFSMWRDIAHTNSDAIAATLLALEQRLAHLRENLKTPELRDEFERANRFRLER
jgi:prephenate dehydrogenase